MCDSCFNEFSSNEYKYKCIDKYVDLIKTIFNSSIKIIFNREDNRILNQFEMNNIFNQCDSLIYVYNLFIERPYHLIIPSNSVNFRS